MLDRDELAARCLVAGLHDPSRSATAAERADFAVECADALLARLRPASGEPATDGGVAFDKSKERAAFHDFAVRRGFDTRKAADGRYCDRATRGALVGWLGSAKRGDGIATEQGVARATTTATSPGSTGTAPHPTLPAAPSPAATPAAWVPSVGDVVKQVGETDEDATSNGVRVVVSTDPLRWVYVRDGARVGGCFEPDGWGNEVAFVRRATSSERAAAGLPVDESATKPVDREGLVAAMNKAARLWVESADKRSLAECHADAAIAFMAKGGA